MKIISIIASFRNEEENINYFVKSIDQTFKRYKNIDYKILFINDFSLDSSEKKILSLKKKNKKILLASTKKNYGGSHSIQFGFDLIDKQSFATVIDCDLQDPPNLLAKTFSEMNDNTLVHFVRKERKENLFQVFYTNIAYQIINIISFGKIVKNSNYFKIIPPYVVNDIKKSKEIYPYWNYFISKFSKKEKKIMYVRNNRKFGSSKFNIFSTNPWATFYSALYYFLLNTYVFFLTLLFLNFLLFNMSNSIYLATILGLTFCAQCINLFVFTIYSIFKIFKKKPIIKAKIYK